MWEELNILEKLLIAETPKQANAAEKHLKSISGDSVKLHKILHSLGAKIAKFTEDETLPNDIRCRTWEQITKHTGIPRTIAKFLRDKDTLTTEINVHLPKEQQIDAREFFDLDCFLGTLSGRDIPNLDLTPPEKAQLLILSRTHHKRLPHLLNKMKPPKTVKVKSPYSAYP